MTAVAAGLVAFVTAVAGATCAAADGALLSMDEEPPSTGATNESIAVERGQSHRALSIARLVMQLATGAAAAIAVRLWMQPAPVAVVLAVAIALGTALVVEMGPRTVGEAYGNDAARRLLPIVSAARSLFGGLVSASTKVDAATRRVLPAEVPAEPGRAPAAEPLGSAASNGAGNPGDRRALIRRVAALAETEVHAVMMPRVEITGIEQDTPWSEVLDRVRSSEHARLPVYDETIDNIIGILLAKDLLHAAVAGEPPEGGWLPLVRPATFIPESKTIDAQLRDFKAADAHIAIVVDEYGGTAGLITIEDALEEIVGDIRDEHDDEAPTIESENGSKFWFAGRVTLEELSEALQHRIERADIATVGGLIYDVLGRVPRAGEVLMIDGFRVVVERVVRRRVQRVYFERAEALAEETT
ncbi:MAG TPA: hemolysin family protein [Gemmatimonadaceae bacterium]|nr:hemolysin family protein [Gemmatimonadaceae bacterium]